MYLWIQNLYSTIKIQEEKINKLIEEKNESNHQIKKLENAIKEIKEQLIPLKEVKIKKENYENFRESKILINKNDIILFSNFIIPKFKN